MPAMPDRPEPELPDVDTLLAQVRDAAEQLAATLSDACQPVLDVASRYWLHALIGAYLLLFLLASAVYAFQTV